MEGIWHGGHLAQRANDMEGIWFWRAFGPRAFGLGGHLEEGFWNGGHLVLEGIWSKGIFLRAFGKRAFGRGHLVGGQVTPNHKINSILFLESV